MVKRTGLVIRLVLWLRIHDDVCQFHMVGGVHLAVTIHITLHTDRQRQRSCIRIGKASLGGIDADSVAFCSSSFAFSRVVMDYAPGDSAEGGEGLRGICYIERGTSDNGGGCLTLVKQLIDARQTIV